MAQNREFFAARCSAVAADHAFLFCSGYRAGGTANTLWHDLRSVFTGNRRRSVHSTAIFSLLSENARPYHRQCHQPFLKGVCGGKRAVCRVLGARY